MARLSLPITFISVMAVFAPVCSKPVWQPVKVLITGAILAPGRRTVSASRCVMGLGTAPHLQRDHRVLTRAVWSPLTASRLLLRRLVALFVPGGVVVCGLDDTLERRRGDHLRAKGLYRDPVRSSHAHVVPVRGWRWRCCTLLTPRQWAGRVGALPCLTVLCPSERFYEPQGRSHQTLGERAWHIIRVVVRWWPGRDLVCVADSRDAVLEWLHQVSERPRARLLPRLRLAAALDDPPPARAPGQLGRPRLKGDRRPTLEAVWADEDTTWSQLTSERWSGDAPRAGEVAPESAVWSHSGTPPMLLRWVLRRDPHTWFEPQALVSTNLDQTPEQILTWCIRRWTMAVTREEARAHLGLETQRQWKARAMARTTPALWSL
jgi:hypothetical protein